VIAPDTLVFGPFELRASERVLLQDGKPLRLGSRALDILIVLTERAGEVIGKDELAARVWPNIFVEEANLRVHVAALRKLLHDGSDAGRYIATIPGRGYSFVAPIIRRAGTDEPAQAMAETASMELPPAEARIIGRADAMQALRDSLPLRRFVTIVGPGGIGKTTVAIAVADELATTYRDGVRFVNLAPVSDPLLVPSTLASVLGLSVVSDDAVPSLLAFLRGKNMLIVLDNCEHVVGAAAILAEQVLRSAPASHVLATSREPLRAEGEWVHRLPGLEIPTAPDQLSAGEALRFPAIQLFVERAIASSVSFQFQDADVPVVAQVCRRLDGIPLAIELAAAQAGVLGLAGVSEQLRRHLGLLGGGRRTATSRHQTLKATLDWSFGTLTAPEQTLLRRLSVFAGPFTAAAAAAIAASPGTGEAALLEALTDFAGKSLVAADVKNDAVRFRLLEMTRVYALERLQEADELDDTACRHAAYYRTLFERADAEWNSRPTDEWLRDYSDQADNLRAALEWGLSDKGNVEIAVRLAAAAVPLWLHLSLINECRASVGRAVQALRSGPPALDPTGRIEMKLLAALGLSMIYTRALNDEIRQALLRSLELADQLDNPEYKLRALWGLFVSRFNEGNFLEAKKLAERFRMAAQQSGDPYDLRVGDRLLGFSLHFLGDQRSAKSFIENMLSGYVAPDRRPHLVRYQYDQRVAARVPLASIYWLQGCPDQAMRTAQLAVEEARGTGHALSLGYALSMGACPTALQVGDLAAAHEHIPVLLDHSARYSFGPWNAWARYFTARLAFLEGDRGAVDAMAAVLHELKIKGFGLRFNLHLGELAEALCSIGRVESAAETVDEALTRAVLNQELWCTPELLRIKGETVRASAREGAEDTAESYFQDALELARRHEALSWQLRCAMSLTRLSQGTGREQPARGALREVLGRYREGFRSRDVREALALLETAVTAPDEADAPSPHTERRLAAASASRRQQPTRSHHVFHSEPFGEPRQRA
jgi:predicted ATPase/DNA-binding winged helix-turn-helix (wHTH) protein